MEYNLNKNLPMFNNKCKLTLEHRHFYKVFCFCQKFAEIYECD